MTKEQTFDVRSELQKISDEISICASLAYLIGEMSFQYEYRDRDLYAIAKVVNSKLEHNTLMIGEVRKTLFGE